MKNLKKNYNSMKSDLANKFVEISDTQRNYYHQVEFTPMQVNWNNKRKIIKIKSNRKRTIKIFKTNDICAPSMLEEKKNSLF